MITKYLGASCSLSIAMTTLLIRLIRLEWNITWGLLVNEQSFVVPCNRLGRQVYSPKIRVILPLYACHSDQVILEWLAVLLTVNLIKTLNLSKLKRRLVMWGPAYRFELRINSVVVRPLNSTWYWGLAAYESLVFSDLLFSLNIVSSSYLCTILTYGLKWFRPCSLNQYGSCYEYIWGFDNPFWLWTVSRQQYWIMDLELYALKLWNCHP